jgi:chitinase
LSRTTYTQATHVIIPTNSAIEGATNMWAAKAKKQIAQFDKKMVERKFYNLKQSTNNGNDGQNHAHVNKTRIGL